MAWCFEDEASAEADEMLQKVVQQGALVPNLWHLEVGNVLLQAVRRNRIKPSQAASMIELLRTLPLQTDEKTSRRALRESFDVASRYELSLYDAAYLELAMRTSLPLASFDKALRKAAKRASVALL
jgi:predicted nucleic acid-binding protein